MVPEYQKSAVCPAPCFGLLDESFWVQICPDLIGERDHANASEEAVRIIEQE